MRKLSFWIDSQGSEQRYIGGSLPLYVYIFAKYQLLTFNHNETCDLS